MTTLAEISMVCHYFVMACMYVFCCRCIDPLDGTVNFAHGYPGFCVSIGVLRHATPLAGCVIEFTGGPGGWGTRKYTAARNHGAKCNGQPMRVSATKRLEDALLVSSCVLAVVAVQHDNDSGCQGFCLSTLHDI